MCWFDCFIGWFSFSFFLFFFGLHRRRRCRRCRRCCCCCCCYCYCCSASEMWLLFLISLYRRAGGRSLCGGHCDVIVAALSVSFFGDSGTILQSLSLSHLTIGSWILSTREGLVSGILCCVQSSDFIWELICHLIVLNMKLRNISAPVSV